MREVTCGLHQIHAMLFAGRLGLGSLLRFPPLDQSSDDDASISDYLHPSQSLLNVENWFSES